MNLIMFLVFYKTLTIVKSILESVNTIIRRIHVFWGIPRGGCLGRVVR